MDRGRVTDSGEVDPDPTFKNKNRIRIRTQEKYGFGFDPRKEFKSVRYRNIYVFV